MHVKNVFFILFVLKTYCISDAKLINFGYLSCYYCKYWEIFLYLHRNSDVNPDLRLQKTAKQEFRQ